MRPSPAVHADLDAGLRQAAGEGGAGEWVTLIGVEITGNLPGRDILTGLGPVPVRLPKVRDRSGSGIKFNSARVSPYVRKAQRVEAALPWRY
ncbi:MAG: hypothetical protein IPM89_06210 [Candidatus Competibacteraceae bacterium]|nr:MAG: hypothetical protein IPM89_06210 [Candidatus Competibacteraceae bacterium]